MTCCPLLSLRLEKYRGKLNIYRNNLFNFGIDDSKPTHAMNSLNFFQTNKRELVKFLLIILLGLYIANPSFSNPIIPPPVVLEIYFGTWSWEIEIMNNEFNDFVNLDNLWLVGKFDTAQFEPGHSFLPGELNVVSNYSMLSPMTIEQSGDAVNLCYKSGNYFISLGGLSWGSLTSEVTAPVGEQSIAYQRFDLPEYDWSYWEAKELPNTIHSSPGHVIKRATFSGYVRDKDDQPMADIWLDYPYSWVYYYDSYPTVPQVHTNSSGYFYCDDMYCRKFHITFRIGDFYGPGIGDTTVNLEPDSANYFEFKLDTLLTGIPEIKSLIPGYSIINNPNPSSSQTTFSIETNIQRPDQKGVIKIYSENGFIVDIIPVNLTNDRQEIIYNCNDKALSAGVYFYNLEVWNHKVASGKMVISQ
jgi:hypothetical protein